MRFASGARIPKFATSTFELPTVGRLGGGAEGFGCAFGLRRSPHFFHRNSPVICFFSLIYYIVHGLCMAVDYMAVPMRSSTKTVLSDSFSTCHPHLRCLLPEPHPPSLRCGCGGCGGCGWVRRSRCGRSPAGRADVHATC